MQVEAVLILIVEVTLHLLDHHRVRFQLSKFQVIDGNFRSLFFTDLNTVEIVFMGVIVQAKSISVKEMSVRIIMSDNVGYNL